jgi:hypothetical protein
MEARWQDAPQLFKQARAKEAVDGGFRHLLEDLAVEQFGFLRD